MWLMPVKENFNICLYALLIKHRCITEEAFQYRLIVLMLGSCVFNLFTTVCPFMTGSDKSGSDRTEGESVFINSPTVVQVTLGQTGSFFH